MIKWNKDKYIKLKKERRIDLYEIEKTEEFVEIEERKEYEYSTKIYILVLLKCPLP